MTDSRPVRRSMKSTKMGLTLTPILTLTMFAIMIKKCTCLDNGLATRPPLGWITSERFACNTDCLNYPDDCISETLVTSTVDAMVRQNMDKAGYEYVILGDCWMNRTFDTTKSTLQPDPKRFPNGIKYLAEYAHKRGLKLGIQMELGNVSANGFPGCNGHFRDNAANFVAWGIDLVAATGHSIHRNDLASVYPEMGSALNKTGRPIVFFCNWPAEALKYGSRVDYSHVASVCNMYTTDSPMLDSWESLEAAIKFFENHNRDVANFSGPGHWHTANNLLVGDFGLSEHEQRMQMAVWSIMASPILVSSDLRNLNPDQLALITNSGTLGIDQDMLHYMGRERQILGQVHIWMKPILPKGSFALLFMYFNISGGPSRVSILLQDLGLVGAEAYTFTDIFTGKEIGVYKPWHTFNCQVDPVGSVFIRAVPLPPTINIKVTNN